MKSVKPEEEYNFRISFDKTTNQKYLVKISGKVASNEREFEDLILEDFLELKELLFKFDLLDGDVHEKLTEFLCLKNDITGNENIHVFLHFNNEFLFLNLSSFRLWKKI